MILISVVKSIGEVIIIDFSKLVVKLKFKYFLSVIVIVWEKRFGGGF